jgi:hypothetical protein
MISQSAIYCGSANEGRGRGCIRVRSARCERRRADLRPAVLLIFVPYHGHGHSPFLRRAPSRFAFITRRLRRREPPRRAVRYGRQRLSARVPTRAPYLPIAHRQVDHGLSSVMQPPGLTFLQIELDGWDRLGCSHMDVCDFPAHRKQYAPVIPYSGKGCDFYPRAVRRQLTHEPILHTCRAASFVMCNKILLKPGCHICVNGAEIPVDGGDTAIHPQPIGARPARCAA